MTVKEDRKEREAITGEQKVGIELDGGFSSRDNVIEIDKLVFVFCDGCV